MLKKHPFLTGYLHKLNTSPEFYQDDTNYYKKIIELGRCEISVGVSLLSNHLSMTRCGHLDLLMMLLLIKTSLLRL